VIRFIVSPLKYQKHLIIWNWVLQTLFPSS
jgi:hypothetical protein